MIDQLFGNRKLETVPIYTAVSYEVLTWKYAWFGWSDLTLTIRFDPRFNPTIDSSTIIMHVRVTLLRLPTKISLSHLQACLSLILLNLKKKSFEINNFFFGGSD